MKPKEFIIVMRGKEYIHSQGVNGFERTYFHAGSNKQALNQTMGEKGKQKVDSGTTTKHNNAI